MTQSTATPLATKWPMMVELEMVELPELLVLLPAALGEGLPEGVDVSATMTMVGDGEAEEENIMRR
jgi:hypothetical protein